MTTIEWDDLCQKVIDDWEAPAGICREYDMDGLFRILRAITSDSVALKNEMVSRGYMNRPDYRGIYTLTEAGKCKKSISDKPEEKLDNPIVSSENNWAEFRTLLHYYRECIELEGRKQYWMKPEKYGREYCMPKNLGFGWLRSLNEPKKNIVLNFRSEEIMMKSAVMTQDPNNRVCIGYPLLVTVNLDRSTEYFVPLSTVPVNWVKRPENTYGSDSLEVNLDFANATLNLEWVNRCVPYEYHEELFRLMEDISPNGNFDLKLCLPYVLAFSKYKYKIFNPNNLVQQPVDTIPGHETKVLLNTAILFRAVSTPYVKTLIRELDAISKVKPEQLDKTSLAYIYRNPPLPQEKSTPSVPVQFKLTNAEQNEAISYALCRPAVRVQGPPGTGKSQMSVNLIANCIYRGDSVLFTSKNHAALDAILDKSKGFFGNDEPLVKFCISDEGKKRDAWYRTEWHDYASSLPEVDFQKRNAAGKVDNQMLLATGIRDKLLDEENKIEPYLIQEESFSEIEAEYENAISLMSDSPSSFDAKAFLSLYKKIRLFESKGFLSFLKKLKYSRKDRQAIIDDFALKYPNMDILNGSNPDKCRETADKILQLSKKYNAALKSLAKAYSDYEAEKLPDTETLERGYDSAMKAIADNAEMALNLKIREHMDSLTADEILKIEIFCERMKDDHRLPIEAFLNDGDIQEFSSLMKLFHKAMPAWCTSLLSLPLASPFLPAVFDQLIIDEASQVDCVSVIPALYRAKRVVFVGDSEQFQPVITLTEKAHSIVRCRYFSSDSRLMKFTYRNNAAYDILRDASQFKHITLKEHFRCDDDIADYFSYGFYKGELRVRTRELNNRKFPSCLEDKHSFQWVDVKGGISDEIAKAVEKFIEIKESGFDGTIGIITPLRRVVESIRIKLLCLGYSEDDVKVSTAYGFQGGECDVIIFVISYTNDLKGNEVWYVDNDENKNIYNVTISRAKACLIAVGDRNACRRANTMALRRLAEYPKARTGRNQFDSPWESVLFHALLRRGIETQCQYYCVGYYLDMAYIDDFIRIDIEVDGKAYHLDSNGIRKQHDIDRNYALQKVGWTVMRFFVAQLRDDLDGCIDKIEAAIKGAKARAKRAAKV